MLVIIFHVIIAPNPVANPAYTTTYEVTSNLAGGCTNIDTVVVTVVPDFVYSLTQAGTSTCLNATIDFNANPVQSGSYSYDWQPPIHLNNSTISNPTFSSNMPGVFDYEVTITSALGCVKVDTLTIDVVPSYSPDITLTVSDTSILWEILYLCQLIWVVEFQPCVDQAAQLHAQLLLLT